jgi:nucleoside-diphosphate-sugar epimerase
VYHQAALVSVARSVGAPEETFENNVAGTVQLLAACRAAGVRRIVFASSSSVYGEGDTGPRVESQSLRPASPYAASKAAGEAWVQACRAAYDLETVVLRYFNVYGPRQDAGSAYAAAVPRFVDDALAGRPFRIDGDGRQTRDFTFVADVVEANVRVGASSAVVGGVFNVGTGRARAIEDLARAVADGAGVRAELRRGPPRPGDVRASQACVDALEAALAWRPAVGLREGLARVIDAARARRGVPLAER